MRHATVAENLLPMGNIPKNVGTRVPTPIRQEDRVDTYLLALGALCVELARAPHLLPTFLRLIKLAPRTIQELRTQKRAA